MCLVECHEYTDDTRLIERNERKRCYNGFLASHILKRAFWEADSGRISLQFSNSLTEAASVDLFILMGCMRGEKKPYTIMLNYQPWQTLGRPSMKKGKHSGNKKNSLIREVNELNHKRGLIYL